MDKARLSMIVGVFSALAGCAPVGYHRQSSDFVYPTSDAQAFAQCKAEALRDFHNHHGSIFDALDIQSPIRTCMAGKGYNAVEN